MSKHTEYVLYKTREKVSSLSGLLGSDESPPHHFYILVTLKNLDERGNDNEDEGFQSVWFNQNSGETFFKKILDIGDFEEVSKVYGYIGKLQINQTNSHIASISTLATPDDSSESQSLVVFTDGMLAGNINGDTPIRSPSPNPNDPDLPNAKVSPNAANSSNSNKFERKVIEEVVKLFQENNGSFYYCHTYDLTNSVERQQDQIESTRDKADGQEVHNSIWRKCDDWFFWNKVLLGDLIAQINEGDSTKDSFVLPLIQGFVEIETYENTATATDTSRFSLNLLENGDIKVRICVISRRNRYRLGTRFRRRGIDENGNVANFVETEQILDINQSHTLSYVVIRGSIPIYWSQPGIKYRPAPRIDKTYAENKEVFAKHFDALAAHYPNQSQRIIVVNLVEETGKESLLGDAYVEQLAEIDRDTITYVQFDFHEHCKGLKFENVSILKEKITGLINSQLYCWVDEKGFIFKQKHLFRVNCIDCLDRTNVVEMVISKAVIENQLARLGLIIPPAELPHELKRKFQILWANNGDAVSQQYAGTSALKGDFTRTGERNLAGMMKDGVKSANRYYLRFKENYRLLAYEVLQGIRVTEDDVNTNAYLNTAPMKSSAANLQALVVAGFSEAIGGAGSVDENSPSALAVQAEREENIKQLVVDCRKQLVDGREDCYGSWALINYTDSSDTSQIDPDVVLLFTSSAIYVSNYDDTRESFIDYHKIELRDVEKIELGPCSEPSNLVTNLLFRTNIPAFTSPSAANPNYLTTQAAGTKFNILRIYYRPSSSSDTTPVETSPNSIQSSAGLTYFHSFRSSNLRFFNNMVITTKSNDELNEALRGICHTIQSTASFFGFQISFEEVNKFARRKSRTHKNFVKLSRLSTSLDQLEAKSHGPQLQQTGDLLNQRINQLGKMIGNRLFGMTSAKPAQLSVLELIPKQQTIVVDSEPPLVDFTTEEDGDQTVKQEELVVKKPPAPLAVATKPTIGNLATNNGGYVPRVNQKQYANRMDKLNDVRTLIVRNSHTKFVFI